MSMYLQTAIEDAMSFELAAAALAAPRWADEPLPAYTCPAPPAAAGTAPDTREPFGGDPAVAAYAAVLLRTWDANWATMLARTDPKRNPGDTRRLKAIRAGITQAGLDAHYRKIMGGFERSKLSSKRIAWMRGHRELFEFCFAPPRLHGNWQVTKFKKVRPHARDKAELPPTLRHKGSLRVAPSVAAFLIELEERLQGAWPLDKGDSLFTASNYGGHSTGTGTADQGLSVDIYLPPDPARGFFKQREALLFFQAVAELATEATAATPAHPTKWCALYNDSTVGRMVNAKCGGPRVGWQLGWSGKAGNCHGPAPLKLHIHLELQTSDSYEG